VEVINTKFGTAHSLHPLPGKGRGRVKYKDSGPNHHTRVGEGRRLTTTSSTGHPNQLNPDPLTNRPGTMELEFI